MVSLVNNLFNIYTQVVDSSNLAFNYTRTENVHVMTVPNGQEFADFLRQFYFPVWLPMGYLFCPHGLL